MAQLKQTIRVLMADDHEIFRDGLRKLLESEDDIKIVGEASNGHECVHLLTKLKPDILLLFAYARQRWVGCPRGNQS